ncbi:MAG: cell division topological specificity factor [marine bacterium B5-7]|nr:MAG: cell division topological specificity factor [marine bacterium B5-7]
MKWLNLFKREQKNTASLARERLKIIVAHQRHSTSTEEDFIPKLQQELIDVISKYVEIDREQVKVGLERDGEHSVLELNITLPEQQTTAA